MDSCKLVVIGAGSVYTPEIFNEIIQRKDSLFFSEIALVDVEEGWHAAEQVAGLAGRMLRAHGYETKLWLTKDRREALKGADFVISQIRVGGLAARAKDEQLGMSLGLIGQETTGVGGFVNALRTIPVALEIASDIEAVCPSAWLVNFTNPSGIITEAVLKHSAVRCVGLCNVPINMQNDIAKLLGTARENVRCRFMGLNHLSFVTEAAADGQDRLADVLDRLEGNATLMKNIPKAEGAGELAKLLGAIPSPYLQYYYFEEQMRAKQKKEWDERHMTRASEVEKINQTLYFQYENENVFEVPEEVSRRGGSLYSYAALNVIEALAGAKPAELVVNTFNNGAVKELLDTDVVEVNCRVSRNEVKTLQGGSLPAKVRGLVQMVKQYERLTVQAAVERSEEWAVAALLNHPLAHGFENAVQAVESAQNLFPQYIRLRHGR